MTVGFQTADNSCEVNFIPRFLLQPRLAAVGYGLVERLEVFERRLVACVGMDRGHETLLNATGVVQHVRTRRESLGGAGGGGHDKVIFGQLVVGDARNDGEVFIGGGRGHHPKAFSTVLAGGGLKTGRVIGQTDELAKTIVERPVSIPDYHATIHCALGIDPDKVLFAGNRPVPITDHGKPVAEIFA